MKTTLFIPLLFIIALFYLTSCASTTEVPNEDGTEGGKCFPNQTCNIGFICEENTCIVDYCSYVQCTNEWEECNLSDGKCTLKDGFCQENTDCNSENNEICNTNHECEVENQDIEDCTIDGNECSNNAIKIVCNETTLKCEEDNVITCTLNEKRCSEDKSAIEICNDNNQWITTICDDGEICDESFTCIEKNLCDNIDCSLDPNSICNENNGRCECKPDFHTENQLCESNSKEVPCEDPNIENSNYTSSNVTVTWNIAGQGWNAIPKCEWTCINDYYIDGETCLPCTCSTWEICEENGNCSLKDGRCTTNADCSNALVCTNHYCVDPNALCSGQDCNNHGDCEVISGAPICNCNEDQGYFNDGDLSCVDPCNNINCGGNGNCEALPQNNGMPICNCNIGYETESTYSLNCNDINECTKNTDGCSDFCTNTLGSYTCSCSAGYELSSDNKTCQDINECNVNNGNCSQVCENNNGGYQCSCNSGYTIAVDGRTCSDINECNSNNGGCNQICSNSSGSFSCSCNLGYTLLSDGKTCEDINECLGNPCESNQTCINTDGSYTCEDIDYCSSNPCQNGGTCTNGVNSYICDCSGTGYEGTTCSNNIDDCSPNPCQNGGTCSDGVNSYTCNCSGTGYEGTTCQTDINECLTDTDDCNRYATCINDLGSFDCLCSAGYTGDGHGIDGCIRELIPCGGNCEDWEYCNTSDECIPEPGRCTDLGDCSTSDCLLLPDKSSNSSNVSPPPQCFCDLSTHTCTPFLQEVK